MVETAELVADVVEKVAEEVEKVADEVGDHLPEDGNLKKAVTLVEKAAKEVDKAAELAGDIIDKVLPDHSFSILIFCLISYKVTISWISKNLLKYAMMELKRSNESVFARYLVEGPCALFF